MESLTQLSITEAVKLLASKSLSPVELVNAHLARIEQASDLNAYITVTAEQAREAAKRAERNILSGNAAPLEGIPVGVKDLFCTKGVPATACSRILEGFTPSYESTVTDNLFKSGAIMVGKTNMDEFAMGSANINSCYGNVKNPWVRNDGVAVVPGGSSGGSAAAVAARTCMGALGSDTGGSIRQPAAFTGTVGIKPTYGRCSRWGMIAFASSLDQAGVFARSVSDTALMLQAICGHDPKDSTSSMEKVPSFSEQLGKGVKGKKIGIPKEYRADNMPQEIELWWNKGISWLKEAGADIVEVSLPYTQYALPTYYIIAPAEASSNLARYDGLRYGLRVLEEGDGLNDMYAKTRRQGFGDEVKCRIMIGTYVLSAGYYDAYYKKAQSLRTLIYRDFMEAFSTVDALLTPATPTAAFPVGETLDPVSMYLNDVFTVPASLAGLPGMSVPVGLSAQGLPLGLQLIGRPFDEAGLLGIAYEVERAARFAGLK